MNRFLGWLVFIMISAAVVNLGTELPKHWPPPKLDWHYVGDANAQFYTRTGSSNQEWKVSNAGIGATLTEIKPIPTTATQHHVITLFFNQSTTSTANQWSIQSGTGTNCGTGTTAVLPGSATTDKYIGVANTSPPQVLPFYPIPIHVTAGHAICVLGIATQLTRLDMLGYTIP